MDVGPRVRISAFVVVAQAALFEEEEKSVLARIVADEVGRPASRSFRTSGEPT